MHWLTEMTDLANPLSAKMYKVVLLLEYLNPVLKKHVVEDSDTIEFLEIHCEPRTIYFHGVVKTLPEDTLNSLGYATMAFKADFSVTKKENHLIDLTIKRFRLKNPDKPAVDIMRIATKVLPGIKKYFLRELCDSHPELFFLPEENDKVVLDISYFIRHVPTLVSNSFSEIELLRINVSENNRVNFYVVTNLLLIKAMDYFGPACLSVEEIKDKDALELLWENENKSY